MPFGSQRIKRCTFTVNHYRTTTQADCEANGGRQRSSLPLRFDIARFDLLGDLAENRTRCSSFLDTHCTVIDARPSELMIGWNGAQHGVVSEVVGEIDQMFGLPSMASELPSAN